MDWRQPEDIPVRGILKCFVIPPPNIDVPVLPAKFDNRLLFPLCRKCALQNPRGGVQFNYRCTHSEEERGWVTTVTCIEMEEALRNGYRVTRYYRSIEWDDNQWDVQLFERYVAQFMAMKAEASGFPEEVQTEEEQEQFIRECRQRFNIVIEREKMVHNSAKRTIAKLCNNSLWGK